MHQRHARVEQHLSAADILHQVELALMRPFERVPAEPDDHCAVDDVGRQQQRGSDIGDGGDGDDVERIVRAACARPGDQVVDGRCAQSCLVGPT